ncbi:MAG: glycosyltransferase family 4 protein [Cytophagales bacterium]
MITVLATAYAVNPYKGSEDGMGWNFIFQIARFQKVIAVTRENNQAAIEKYMLDNPDSVYQNISFVYFDLPYWMRFWKKGERGALLYYFLWQYFLPYYLKKLDFKVDVVHNVNFHNDWTPSFLWKLNKPFVWGPIGHHPLVEEQFIVPFRKQDFWKEKITWLVKKYFWNISLNLSKTVRKSSHVLCMNSHVEKVLPSIRHKCSIMPSVATEDFGYNPSQEQKIFRILSAGRLVYLKGFDLTIRSFAKFLEPLNESQKKQIKLTIVGKGPLESYYKKLVEDLQILDFVEFISWIDRKDLLQLYQDSSVFLFPSHEGAGMVVAEALSFGVPVVCLNNSGPGEFINQSCGVKVDYSTYEDTLSNLAQGIDNLYKNSVLRNEMSANARKRFEKHFDWDNRGIQLHQIYQKIVS